MSYVKEDYVLGNKKIVVGDNLHDLVLENLGKIYIRYGNSYKDFNELLKSVGKATSFKTFIIETDGLKDAAEYGDGVLVYDAKSGVLYLAYDGKLLELVENVGTNDSKYVRKTGDRMTGQLIINTREAPLIVQSSDMVKNFNANLLEGHDADDFAQKAKNEKITGNWTFAGENEFLKENTFQDNTYFNDTAVFNRTGDSAAIRVGTGDIITDGSLGSSQFASGMTGYGWRLDADTNTLTIDNLIVRGILQVFELVVNKISATNGSFWVTDSFEIEKVHDLKFLEVTAFNKLYSLNVDTYYIPFIYDTDHVFDISATRSEIEEVSKETNFYQISLNDADYPLATRSIKQPKLGVVYDKFEFLFQILDLRRFIAKFGGGRVTMEDFLFNTRPEKGFYYDDLGRLRSAAEGDAFAEWSSDEHIDITLVQYQEPVEGEEPVEIKALTQYDLGNTLIASEDESFPITSMSNRDIMLQLALEGIIQFTFLYQKDTRRINDYITLVADGEDKEVQITPMDELFDKQIYSVVSAVDAHLDQDTGKYVYSDPSNLCRINLYYKYFGEYFNTLEEEQTILDLEMPNLYIVEAKNEQYPVFKPGDILRCQKFTGTAVKQYNAIVLSLVGSYGFLVELQNHNVLSAKTSFSYNTNGEITNASYEIDTALYERSGKLTQDVRASAEENTTDLSDVEAVATAINNEMRADEEVDKDTRDVVETETLATPQKGDALVRIGSIFYGDRQRSMLLTSSEDNSPYQDIIVNVNRPDYGVIYFTPKYKTFDAYFAINGQTRKATFYFQDDMFGYIMMVGDVYTAGGEWESIASEEAKEAMQSFEYWYEHYHEFYEKYREYAAVKEIPIAQENDSEEDYSGISKIVDVALTYQPNWHSPVYYKDTDERERLKVIMPDEGENNEYFVSSKVTAPVISTYNANNPDTVTHYNKKTKDYVLLSIGQTA